MDLRVWFLLPLVAGSGDPLSVQNGKPKNVKSLPKSKIWDSVELSKGNKAIWFKQIYIKKKLADKALWPTRLVEKHGVMFKPSHTNLCGL